MANKVLLGGFSVILVVAVVVGVVATVGRSANKDANNTISPKTSINYVDSICAMTYYKEPCTQTLSHVLNSSSSPIDIARVAIEATLKEIIVALNSTQQFGMNYTDDRIKHTMVYCKSLFEESIELLQVAIEKATTGMEENSNQLSYWIGTITSLTQGCVDVLMKPELKNHVSSSLENTTQLAANAISIVELLAKEGKELQDFQNYNVTKSDRRLLQVQEIDNEGYPRWLSAVDRKLLKVGPGRRAGKWQLKPNFVVSKDGSGDFHTISDAIKAVSANSNMRTVIYVKAGVYREQVFIPKEKMNIYMYGDGGRKTIVTADKCETKGQGIDTNPTFAVEGNGTILRSMRFENTAGTKGDQAVALRVRAELVVVENCHIYAYQDTLYAHAYKQFYRGCVIAGTIDFIFGDAAIILQKCRILLRDGLRDGGNKKRNYVTAQGRICPNAHSGIVIHDCEILPDLDLKASKIPHENYLGRPWKEFARVVIMQSMIGDLINPLGYYPWKGENFNDTATYIEFNNFGPRNATNERVKWRGFKPNISLEEALTFTVASPFIDGLKWLPSSGATFLPGLKK